MAKPISISTADGENKSLSALGASVSLGAVEPFIHDDC